jgi:hypothetical protein
MRKFHPGPAASEGGWDGYLQRWRDGGRERYEKHFAYIGTLGAHLVRD